MFEDQCLLQLESEFQPHEVYHGVLRKSSFDLLQSHDSEPGFVMFEDQYLLQLESEYRHCEVLRQWSCDLSKSQDAEPGSV